MNYDSANFTGEITGNLPTNFKIPLKTNGSTVSKDNQAAAKAFLSDTFSEMASAAAAASAPADGKQFNPMNYYYQPQIDQQQDQKPFKPGGPLKKDIKRKPEVTHVPSEDGLPKELTKLMMSLSCELCSAQMNSPMSAKMHYDSKNHDKKVNAWLLEWSKKTGEPVPKRGKVMDGPAGPNAFHCDICDLALTSLQHASQHYMGKRHRLTLAGRTDPHGSGYYGEDGKWIRTNTKPKVDPTGRFHIGESFKPPPVPAPLPDPEDPDRYCKLCNVSVTSQPQMKLHLEGSKHAKKLKAAGSAPYTPDQNDTILQSIHGRPGASPLITTKQKTAALLAKQRDISIYRTPSGHFYCKPCNCTLATEILFHQHLDSKKHLKSSK